jgi:hypothetical protein
VSATNDPLSSRPLSHGVWCHAYHGPSTLVILILPVIGFHNILLHPAYYRSVQYALNIWLTTHIEARVRRPAFDNHEETTMWSNNRSCLSLHLPVLHQSSYVNHMVVKALLCEPRGGLVPLPKKVPQTSDLSTTRSSTPPCHVIYKKLLNADIRLCITEPNEYYGLVSFRHRPQRLSTLLPEVWRRASCSGHSS